MIRKRKPKHQPKRKPKKKPFRGRRPRRHPCIEIDLIDGMKPQPPEANGSRSKPDRICFCNKTDRGRTVTFDLWPFAEPPHAINIPPGKCSPCLTIYSGQPLGGYSYSVAPALDPGGPPGEPDIVVDP
jgi:hypothetical protein